MNEIEYWDEVEAIFTAVVDLEPAVRASLLETMCAGRPHIRAEVDSLLAANARAEGFALPVTAATGPMEGALPAPDVAGGTVMGAYRLVEEIGSGGMGSVYRAERIEGGFEQRVAIKLVAASMGRPDAERRFRAERQILASLRHPHIVTLLDGGVTAEGQAYLVMEHVEGVPISSYCRERVLTLEARLELFRQVCSAVHFAHRHFVVHRDLKPANILVTADGLAKVLDFGVAKLLDNPASAALPAATVAGLGPFTPNYASPEQLRGLPVTTSSDVYALGVLLYELITGGRPYETADKPFDEVMRLVLEQEPSRPSKARTPVEGGPPYHLRALEGDLDAIVLRAMSKEPERRYGSVDELAADVSRHLDGQAVQAREPSPAYLLGKLAARHKPTVTVAVVSLALLLSALAAAFWQRQAAVHARARAERRYEEVRRLENTLIFKIHDAVAPLPGSTPVRQTIVSTSHSRRSTPSTKASRDWRWGTSETSRQRAGGDKRPARRTGRAMRSSRRRRRQASSRPCGGEPRSTLRERPRPARVRLPGRPRLLLSHEGVAVLPGG